MHPVRIGAKRPRRLADIVRQIHPAFGKRTLQDVAVLVAQHRQSFANHLLRLFVRGLRHVGRIQGRLQIAHQHPVETEDPLAQSGQATHVRRQFGLNDVQNIVIHVHRHLLRMQEHARRRLVPPQARRDHLPLDLRRICRRKCMLVVRERLDKRAVRPPAQLIIR